MAKETVVVVCPGRGSYNKDDLGYFHKHHSDKTNLLSSVDQFRKTMDQVPIADLDKRDTYSGTLHTAGENASALIYACSFADFQEIDPKKFEISAVCGNSMGWYITLACAGAVSFENGTKLINTMGSMGQILNTGVIGGQVITPITGEDWRIDPDRVRKIEAIVEMVNSISDCNVYPSIRLGGFAVIGGDEKGIQEIMKALPKEQGRYPMKLMNHSAFHTPVMEGVSKKAFELLDAELFQSPRLPMIDGRGKVWQPFATDPAELREYTLGHQVTKTFDFTKAIEVAVKEFAPSKIILLGPGFTLGGAIAQSLIEHRWFGLHQKNDFFDQQKASPRLVAMGMEEQRTIALG